MCVYISSPCTSLDPDIMRTLFEEYLTCSGNWLSSNLLLRTSSTASCEVKGREEYIRFADLKKKVGVQAAKEIRAKKREQQKTASPTDPPFIMPHPDMPDSEACSC